MANSRAKTRIALLKEVKKNMAIINARYLISDDGAEIMDTYRKGFAKLTNTKNEKKIALGNYGDFSKEKLNDILAYQNKFLSNPYTDPIEREKIFNKKYDTLKETYGNVTKKQYQKAVDIFNSNVYHKLLERKLLESAQIIDYTVNSNKSSVDIENVLFEIANDNDLDNMSREDIAKEITDRIEML